MRKVEQAMLKAIDDCPASDAGRIFSGGNTTAERWHSGIHGTIGYDAGFSVRLYQTEIAKWSSYDPSSVTLNHGGYRTSTTKSRINAILDYLYGHRFGLYQNCGEWYISRYSEILESRCLLAKDHWEGQTFILDTRRMGIPSVLAEVAA
jgi:hypothetical protein